MKKKNNKKGVIFCLVFFFLLFLCLITITNKKEVNKEKTEIDYKYESRVEELNNYDTHGIKKYGWLQVQGTTIDLPIITNWYVGDINYNYGWMINSSYDYETRKIIAGHNVLNVSKKPLVNDPTLTNFEDLMAFVYYDFAKNNMYLVYTEDDVDYVYVIYAIGFYDYDYKYDIYGLDREEVKDYIDYVKENSIYKYNVDVNKDDDIITIKTCTRMFGINEKQQFQIDARLLRKNEKMYKYDVEKTKLYKEYELKDKYDKISS